MSEKHITKRSAANLLKGETDFQRLRKISDKEIDAAISTDPNAAPSNIDWTDTELVYPEKKMPVSIRLDEDVVNFFKKSGPGYQTRINAVLRSYMEHLRSKRS